MNQAIATYDTTSKNCKEAYPFGFNGQERKDDYKGKGNHNHALYWEYDTRIGRRWNLDPVDQISISNYAVMGNSPIWHSDVLGDDFKDKKGNNVVAGEGIVATKDGSRITNTSSDRNWDYGTWNDETGAYDLKNYKETDGLSAGQLFDLGSIELWSNSSVRALGNILRKAEARVNGDGSYMRNIIEQGENGFGEPELFLHSIVAPVDNAPRVQIVNDLDILAFIPGGGGATGALAKNPPFKPSQIVNGLQKMGKMKGGSVERMPKDVAKILGIDYYELRKLIHMKKAKEGRGGADNYTWDELMNLGKTLKEK